MHQFWNGGLSPQVIPFKKNSSSSPSAVITFSLVWVTLTVSGFHPSLQPRSICWAVCLSHFPTNPPFISFSLSLSLSLFLFAEALLQVVVDFILTCRHFRLIHKELEWALGRAHTFAYHKIGHWIINMLALVACQMDNNWPCYGKKKILTFSWPWPLTRSIPKSNQMVPG